MSWKRKTAEAANDETEHLWVPKGKFTISVSMTDSAVVTVYRFTGDNSQGNMPLAERTPFYAVGDTITASVEKIGDEGAGAWYYLKCTTHVSNDVPMAIGV